ncbi:unnamed protein product, partial [Ectocarpus fasciculatus]
ILFRLQVQPLTGGGEGDGDRQGDGDPLTPLFAYKPQLTECMMAADVPPGRFGRDSHSNSNKQQLARGRRRDRRDQTSRQSSTSTGTCVFSFMTLGWRAQKKRRRCP